MENIEQELAEATFKILAEPTVKETTVPPILTERQHTHGNFADTARCIQELKAVIRRELGYRAHRKQPPLTFKQLEAIEMIMHKVGRIVAGEAGFHDHWVDIAGYANLPISDV